MRTKFLHTYNSYSALSFVEKVGVARLTVRHDKFIQKLSQYFEYMSYVSIFICVPVYIYHSNHSNDLSFMILFVCMFFLVQLYDQPRVNSKKTLMPKMQSPQSGETHQMVEQSLFDIYLCDNCEAELYSQDAYLVRIKCLYEILTKHKTPVKAKVLCKYQNGKFIIEN